MNRSEMRTLGRIGQPLSGGTYRPRRRFRAPRWLALLLTVGVLAVLWVGVNATRQVGARPAEIVAADQVPARPAAGDRVSRDARTADARLTFATVDGLELAVPHPDPVAIGFAEATRVEALAFAPVGRAIANDNSAFPTPAPTQGPEYRVLPAGDLGRPPTSAADVAVPLGDQVAAPVTGTVTRVTEYPLSGGIQDWRVEITPQDRPDLTVILVHLLHPTVRVGDPVTAGQTPLAVARLLPFDSPIDAVLDRKQPHTHIEVKPSVAPAPIDPNAPAAPATTTAGG